MIPATYTAAFMIGCCLLLGFIGAALIWYDHVRRHR